MASIATLATLAVLLCGMAIEERRERDRTARRRLIVTTARRLAEAEGWDAVTTRRLATEIEYSQPVLYKHFGGMDAIADAVALDGFAELGEAMRSARSGADTAGAHPALARVSRAYLDFARENPSLYDAMFTRTTSVRFAVDDTPPELTGAFAELRAAVAAVADGQDADTLTEVVWAALHGLVALDRAGRLRPDHVAERVDLLVSRFARAAQ